MTTQIVDRPITEQQLIWEGLRIKPDTLYVSVDIAKFSHKALIFDSHLKILEGAFSFDATQDGFSLFLGKIRQAAGQASANQVIVGMEATGHYHETLAHTLKSEGFDVIVINPYATLKTRHLNIDYVKTDEIDLKAISHALLLGKGHPAKVSDDIYAALRLLTRFRRKKCNELVSLKNQLQRDLDRLWPGLVQPYERSKGLFTDLWGSKIARSLLTWCPSPRHIRENLKEEGLLELFRSRGMKGVGWRWAQKIVNHASHAALPSEAEENILISLLQRGLPLLQSFEGAVQKLDRDIAISLQKTEANRLLSIQGVNSVTAGEFIGEVGDPKRYRKPSQWIRLAGLHASRSQSGTYDRKQNPMTKAGNRYLRATLFQMARNVCRWEPFFMEYKDRFVQRGKPIGVAYGAVANRFVRIAWHMIVNKENFDSEKAKGRREERRKTGSTGSMDHSRSKNNEV
jgi:transposase